MWTDQNKGSGISTGAIVGILFAVVCILCGLIYSIVYWKNTSAQTAPATEQHKAPKVVEVPEAPGDQPTNPKSSNPIIKQVSKTVHPDGKVTVKETSRCPIKNTVSQVVRTYENEESAAKAGFGQVMCADV